MNYYELVGWKNRSEGKVTKVSAERLNHMDNQILANANAIGNIEEIAGLADGTLCGTVKENNNDIEKLNNNLDNNYQKKLTNPLTQSDVVNSLTSTSTTKPLSAAQGKVINDKLIDYVTAKAIGINTAFPAVGGSSKSYTNAKLKGKLYIDVSILVVDHSLSRTIRLYTGAYSGFHSELNGSYVDGTLLFDSSTGKLTYETTHASGWNGTEFTLNNIYYY